MADANRWTIISDVGKDGRALFRCECGTEKWVDERSARMGRSKSCGCLRDEVRRRSDSKYKVHGQSSSPTYMSWRSMINRCANKNARDYPCYGGRGVTVCDRWKDFRNFYIDMGDRPKGMTLERNDVDGPYAPHNCVWATAKRQARNRRDSRMLTVNGQTLNVCDWAEQFGVGRSTIVERLRRGWSEHDAVLTPALRKGLEVLTQDRAEAANRAFQPPKAANRGIWAVGGDSGVSEGVDGSQDKRQPVAKIREDA